MYASTKLTTSALVDADSPGAEGGDRGKMRLTIDSTDRQRPIFVRRSKRHSH